MTTAVHIDAEIDDGALVHGFLNGDEACLDALHRRWGPLVYAQARRSTGDAREAEDITQLVFFAAWRGRAGFVPERGTLPGWLLGITRRKIADALAARTRRTELVDAAAAQLLLTAADDAVQPEAALDRVLLADELSRLPSPNVRCSTWPSTTISPRPRSPNSPVGRWVPSRATRAAACTAWRHASGRTPGWASAWMRTPSAGVGSVIWWP